MTESPIEKLYQEAVHEMRYPQLSGLVREYEFTRTCGRKFRFDFAIPAEKIAIELDGYRTHASSPEAFADHTARQNEVVEDGWRLIRFTGKHINDDAHGCVYETARIVAKLTGGEMPPKRPMNPFAPGVRGAVEVVTAESWVTEDTTLTARLTADFNLTAADIELLTQEWLWADGEDHWIPAGGLVLLAGAEGTGKSHWVARIVARVTRGELPGKYFGQPKRVVMMAPQAQWEQVIIPRLAAAGADLCLVSLVLPGEIPLGEINAMTEAIEQMDVGLIVLDTLDDALGEALDRRRDSAVRRALEPLDALASHSGITVLGVVPGGTGAPGAVGSKAFTAMARAVLMCVRDPRPTAESRYLFGQLKNNLAPQITKVIPYHVVSAANSSRIDTTGESDV